ncbi:MAG: gamma-glutamyltransferase [Gemmatimonadetes bacterium]|nr:gamma-glutamyltransferase [Gemmatimonadota bacterium]NIO32721.1 gamma-glutamyltransferase [Gemmatimonadota bacterium]
MRIRRVEGSFEATADGKCAAGARGAVASAFPEATTAGIEILAQGGNAVDAACAVGLALTVCEPQASGLGGQSTGLLHFNRKTMAIDGSSRVPSLAHRSRVDPEDCQLGYRAATVPSTPATYGWLHRSYGTLDWRTVLEPAIYLARNGYRITELQNSLLVRELENFKAVESRSGARYFLKPEDTPYAPGELFRQPELADVLEHVARYGADAFYQGEIAEQIDADMRANDGFLRNDDLALIPWPIERKPLARRYRGLLVKTMPPPGSGRTLLLVLMILSNLESRFLGRRTPNRYHFLAEAFRKAFMQRLDRPFDPATYPQIREKKMLSRDFARETALTIAEEVDVQLPLEDPVGAEVGETTHFSVMDSEGNAVSMTQSIELVYGSKVAADGLGFLYNNYMMALELDNPAHPYFLRPNAVPWSSAAPTIVFRKKEPWLVLGSPGSERINSTLGQVLVRVIDGSDSIGIAVNEPRFHCSIGGTMSLEAERFDPAVVNHLRRLGYKIKEREPLSFYLGCVQAVLKRQTGPGFEAVADVRRDGTAAGLD